MTATPRAVIALGASAVFALVFGVAAGTVVLLVVGALTVVDALSVRRAPVVARDVPSILPRGYAYPISVSVDTAPDRLRIRQPVLPDVAVVPSIAAGALTGTITAHRRGRHELPAPVVRVDGPLRLGRWVHEVPIDGVVAVYPDVITARRISRAVATGRFQSEGRRRSPLVGLGTEFDSIREYSADDDIRLVNWRATARLGRPMSNQYQIDRDRDVICVVDAGRLMGSPLGWLTRLDAAVDAVTAIAYTADALGDRAGVVAFRRRIERELAPRRNAGEAIVHAIHDLEPVEEDADYEAAFHLVARRKRALVVVFTDLLDESAAAPLIRAVPILARTHAVVVATSRDEGVTATVTADPDTLTDVYRAEVAWASIGDKDRAAAQLRRAGATVVEAGPGQLPAAVVSAYVEAKTRARI